MNELMQHILNIEMALATETNHFKRWCQRKELRKTLKQIESMREEQI